MGIAFAALALLFTIVLLAPVTRRLLVFWLLAAKHTTLWLLGRVGLARAFCRVTGQPYVPPTVARSARLLCEDLGPTFVKLGQIIASSAGIFPEEYVAEFQKCLDQVRPVRFVDIERALEEELGEKRRELDEIDPIPLASASIAQVHTARLPDGKEVVLKVQRPGIEKRVTTDVCVMRWVARMSVRLKKTARMVNPVAFVDDFARTIVEELDFRGEAENLDRFNEVMGELGYSDIRAPIPEWQLTTRRVLVMERFRGIRIDQVEEIERQQIDAETALVRGLKSWFQCVIFHGFFHGDVHAGNLLLLDNGDIGFLDFGIVGRFDNRQRRLVTDYMVSFVTGDYATLAQTIVDMGGAKDAINIAAFAADLEVAYSPLRDLSFGQVNYAELLPKISEVALAHGMVMPREFVLITKQTLYFDRYAKLLAPDLNVLTDPRLLASMISDIQKVRSQKEQPSDSPP